MGLADGCRAILYERDGSFEAFEAAVALTEKPEVRAQ